MNSPAPISLENPLCELAECPLWHPDDEALYWTDINGRRLWRHKAGRGAEMVWEGPMMVGGFAHRVGGGFVLCTDQGVFTADENLAHWEQLHAVPMAERERFNDVTTDPRGRLFAGTLIHGAKAGTLYRIERGKEPVPVIRGIGVSNGMTFSLDERTFYHTDSMERSITAYDYDVETGGIGNPRLYFKSAEEDGSPDGITIDRDGFIWAACWGGSQVLRLDPHGRIAQRIAMPAKQPSSVMFGGGGLETLYVTSAHEGSADPERGLDAEGNFLGGHVYHFKTDTAGRPEWKAQV